jgi:NAD(P)-dependent dehydrogenase (short-subunit alcohol dehydrogenase family)
MKARDSIFDVEGKVILVTGGLGQLGRQYAGAFAERGAKVFVLDRDMEAEAAVQKLGNLAGRVSYLPVDVTSRASLESALKVIQASAGTPEVLVNNAAIDSPPGSPAGENGPFEDYPEASFDQVMSVNVKGVVLCCQVFGGVMARAGRGSIINISSIYGVVSPDQRIYEYRKKTGPAFFKPVAYSASKSALLNLTRYLATYWADCGVRVNSVTLAGVFNRQDPEFLAAYCPKVPLGRMAREDEYNGTMIFLASNASSYMTGVNVVVDGGFTAW